MADTDHLKTAYQETCKTYHNIDDFRAKLLGLLPLASGAGIFFLSKDNIPGNENHNILAGAGLLGFIITLGLLIFELRGIQYCIRIISVGKLLERKMKIYGQFRLRPKPFCHFIDVPIASGIIYPAVLAAWIFLFVHSLPHPFNTFCLPYVVAILVFCVFVSIIIVIVLFAYKDKDKEVDDDMKNSLADATKDAKQG